MIRKRPSHDQRTEEQVRRHYEVEKELATRLREAPKGQRASLYAMVYDELFQRVLDHPQLGRSINPTAADRIVEDKMRLLRPFLVRDAAFLELGAGDCRLAVRVAREVMKPFALEVLLEVTKNVDPPPNFELVISSGTDIPVPKGSINVAYRYQLMEHIHPEDAVEQLQNIYDVLAPNGIYICITPNRLSGPHDISRYFDRLASGFHMREYTLHELDPLFRSVGFRETYAYGGIRGRFTKIPIWLIAGLERSLSILPWGYWSNVSELPGVRHLLMAAIVATK